MIKSKDLTNQFTMDQDYDYAADSLLLYITEDYEYQKSLRLDDDIILDFDKNDVPVALELLNASKTLRVNKSSLLQPIAINMQVCIGKEKIRLDASFSVFVHQKLIPKDLNWQVSNDINLTETKSQFATA
ncbi:DUF2283 domain-containing protein [Methanobacterium alkalithermotolerans]|uniref:DUF2283 domain-containing protein n=1 Tax=Methanobacterium alkalithermotolerans TaxID=2731220 RepID=A0A8T8K6H8_9EURY|nr:DUF2283 domain-containing protein [Methanobacterium alkalithermotolerans]QUH24184.1 DUF2283 domain-containing protein [Methanobacterium alkalithermotolerans]